MYEISFRTPKGLKSEWHNVENFLHVSFGVREDGVVELLDFSRTAEKEITFSDDPEPVYPLLEVQVTGKTTRGMHAEKHNMGSASLDFRYRSHAVTPRSDGEELIFELETDYGLAARYHMRFFTGIPAVRVWTELENRGSKPVGLEYVSSFIYQGLCSGGKRPYYKKADIYTPNNGWCCEAQWQKRSAAELNLGGMMVDGFNCPGSGNNRYWYGSVSSWSSCEYLPMGLAADRETEEIYCFQIESSGQWLAEYGSGVGGRLYLALSGPTESEQGWWKNLKPGEAFVTVPAAFGMVRGDVSEAVSVLTHYRRAIRRENTDDRLLNVVFNDYMNCLMGDPTEEREKPIIDAAAALGCEYYCLDAGWYDKGYWWNRVGEWKESPERFPGGLKALCDYAHSKGLKMGLWLEIEVMGIACPLAAELPDSWFVCRHGKRRMDNGRYLLDFRNPEVRRYCRGVVDRLIRDYGVDYFKVDYNVTMGHGSELDADSGADAMLEHYRCLHQWYRELFRDYPELVIENCGSGGQRMDYGMLELLSLQSTSDQTDYLLNSYIAANVASAVAPEQAGMWVYPYEDNAEHVIYNMVNGLLLRPYISGMVWKLSEENLALLREGIALYKEIRKDIREGVPFFPLGFSGARDKVLAYGVRNGSVAYLAVFAPGKDKAKIPLSFAEKVTRVSVLYPSDGRCDYSLEKEMLRVKLPQKRAARLFRLELEP